MSACISRHGEFSSHTLDDTHTCTLCHVLDEEAIRAELTRLRAEVARHETDREFHRLVVLERDHAIARRERIEALFDDLVVRRRDLVGALRAANAREARDRPVLEAAEAYRERVREFVGCDYHQWLQDCEDTLIAAVDARGADSPRETGEQEIVCEHCNGRDGEHTVRNCTGAKPRYCVPCRKLMGVKGIAAHRETAEHRAQVESYRQYKARQAERWALPEAEEGLPEELLNARIRFWVCPLGHSERKPDAPLRQTVEWRGDVAHCLEPGCGRTSAETKVKLPVCADCGHRHRWGGECADHSWRDSCPYEAGADCDAGTADRG